MFEEVLDQKYSDKDDSFETETEIFRMGSYKSGDLSDDEEREEFKLDLDQEKEEE
jgi:hypothetical protein